MVGTILTIIGTGCGVVALIYTAIRNFRLDMDTRFDKMDVKFQDAIDKMDQRVTETNKRMDGIYNLLIKKMGT